MHIVVHCVCSTDRF